MRSTTLDIRGLPVHLAEWGDGPVRFVLVHGLAGSHLNWMSVAPGLSRLGRVVAPDLPGFGRTPVRERRTTVPAYRTLVDDIVSAVASEPVVLAGNSMGGLVSLLEASIRPKRVAGLVLVNSVLPGPVRNRVDPLVVASFASYLVPGVGLYGVRRIGRRIGHEEMVRQAIALCAADARTIPAEVVDAHLELSRQRGSRLENDRAFVRAARSIVVASLRRRRFRRVIARVSAPTLVLHGERDRLVSVEAAQRTAALRPDWDLRVFDGLGHIPMMEAPDRFLETVQDWLKLRQLHPRAATPGSVAAANLA